LHQTSFLTGRRLTLHEFNSVINASRRLEAVLRDLLDIAPAERRQAGTETVLVGHKRPYALLSDADGATATTPDQQGIGSGRDVVRPRAGTAAAAHNSLEKRTAIAAAVFHGHWRRRQG
jgi:hypothetical protein